MNSTVDVIDPALRKLLDTLPVGDPDAAPPEMAEVWIPWCIGSHFVPVGVPTRVDFGLWHGPRMHWSEQRLFCRRANGHEESCQWTTWRGLAYLDVDTRIDAIVTVHPLGGAR